MKNIHTSRESMECPVYREHGGIHWVYLIEVIDSNIISIRRKMMEKVKGFLKKKDIVFSVKDAE